MKQNLVFIMTDQQRADTIGMTCAGQEVTPALNSLAAKSTVFERAYNACPLCVPARTALATGLSPLKNGMMLNDLPGQYAKNNKTIHQMLSEAGYEVAHIGVNHISVKPSLKSSIPFAAWEDDDTYAAHAHAAGMKIDRREEDSVVIDELADGLYEKHRYSNARVSFWPYPAEEFKDVWFTGKAVEYLGRPHEKPFALFLYLWAPHPPLIVPEEYWNIFDESGIILPPGTGKCALGEPSGRRKSAAAQLGGYPPKRGWREGWHAHLSLSRLCDDQVRRILDALKQYKLESDTAVVFTTDHGEHMGQHSMYQKMELYEAAVRVPAIFHVPGTKQSRIKTPISHLDFVPTLAELFALPVGERPAPSAGAQLDGRSLKECIVTGTEPEERPVFGVYCGNHQFGDMRRMVVSGNYKYIYDNQEGELYDLSSDPHECTNLCGDSRFRETACRLHHQLEQWRREQRDPFFKAVFR